MEMGGKMGRKIANGGPPIISCQRMFYEKNKHDNKVIGFKWAKIINRFN